VTELAVRLTAYVNAGCVSDDVRSNGPNGDDTGLLAIFLGSFGSGLLGRLWSILEPGQFFALVGVVCSASAALLMLFDRPIRRAEALEA
jgi:uncharacterized membrane protein YjjB (DUF3815 family)